MKRIDELTKKEKELLYDNMDEIIGYLARKGIYRIEDIISHYDMFTINLTTKTETLEYFRVTLHIYDSFHNRKVTLSTMSLYQLLYSYNIFDSCKIISYTRHGHNMTITVIDKGV